MRFFLVTLIVSLLPLSTFASDPAPIVINREKFIEWCDTDRDKAALYVQGYNDATERARRRFIDAARRSPRRSNEYTELRFRTVGAFCPPSDVPIKTYVEVACTWMKKRLDKKGQSASTLLPQAYRGTYPCLEE